MTKRTEHLRLPRVALAAACVVCITQAPTVLAASHHHTGSHPARTSATQAGVASEVSAAVGDSVSSRIADSLQTIASAEKAASDARANSGLSIDKWYPMLVSTLAFLLSGGLGFYTFRKDAKVRRQSITDDYWLRKVVSPIAIEPVVKFLLESVAGLPPDCCASNYSVSDIDAYLQKYQKDHALHATNLFALGLLKTELYDDVSAHFDDVEDAIITYCAANRNAQMNATGGPAEAHAKAAETIQRKLNEMLQLVRNYQAGVK
ncbi:hypothetical protein [Burkholderia multivorans]|uniref:hypothetical protein n=1 Tax=Burkholderia multivorans TaxID=87883 RepID=UPI0011B1D6BF|nr:hypothetical protein [Burkholderia multivorans]MDN7995951.1 hypothetical protein [Burkholderia multivorans]